MADAIFNSSPIEKKLQFCCWRHLSQFGKKWENLEKVGAFGALYYIYSIFSSGDSEPSSSKELTALERIDAKLDELTSIVKQIVGSEKKANKSELPPQSVYCFPCLTKIYSWNEFFQVGLPYDTYGVQEDNRVYCTACPRAGQKRYPLNVLTRKPNGNKSPAFSRILNHIKIHVHSDYHRWNTGSCIQREMKIRNIGLKVKPLSPNI